MVWVSGVKLDISIILIVVMFSGAYTSVKTLNMLRLLYADYTLIKLKSKQTHCAKGYLASP